MRKGRIKYYFKNKNAVINDVGKLCDMNEQLEQELERYKNIIKLLKHFGENSLGIIYALKDNVEPTENEWLNLIEYEKYLRELKGSDS